MSRCELCAYFSEQTFDRGECRKNPPKMFAVPMQSIQGQGIGFQAMFPIVTPSTWCGAFDDGNTISHTAIVPTEP